MAHQVTAEGIEAIRLVIHGIGFHTWASEFVSRPADRQRIVKMTCNVLIRDGKPADARRFASLAEHVLNGTRIYAS